MVESGGRGDVAAADTAVVVLVVVAAPASVEREPVEVDEAELLAACEVELLLSPDVELVED